MNVREKIESFENLTLIKEAAFSNKSLGRHAICRIEIE